MGSNNIEKAKEDILDSKEFLLDAIRNYEAGITIYHKQMAIQLYALLCGKNALIPRLFPDARFNKLIESSTLKSFRESGVLPDFLMIGGITIENEKVGHKLFADEMILLDKWLEQTIIVVNQKELSIRELIKGIRDKSAAHFDPDFHEDLKTVGVLYFGNNKSYESLVCYISKYVVSFLDEVITHNGLKNESLLVSADE